MPRTACTSPKALVTPESETAGTLVVAPVLESWVVVMAPAFCFRAAEALAGASRGRRDKCQRVRARVTPVHVRCAGRAVGRQPRGLGRRRTRMKAFVLVSAVALAMTGCSGGSSTQDCGTRGAIGLARPRALRAAGPEDRVGDPRARLQVNAAPAGADRRGPGHAAGAVRRPAAAGDLRSSPCVRRGSVAASSTATGGRTRHSRSSAPTTASSTPSAGPTAGSMSSTRSTATTARTRPSRGAHPLARPAHREAAQDPAAPRWRGRGAEPGHDVADLPRLGVPRARLRPPASRVARRSGYPAGSPPPAAGRSPNGDLVTYTVRDHGWTRIRVVRVTSS